MDLNDDRSGYLSIYLSISPVGYVMEVPLNGRLLTLCINYIENQFNVEPDGALFGADGKACGTTMF